MIRIKIKGKKGIALGVIAQLILIIIGGIIILLIVTSVAGFLSPAMGGMGCGLNIRIRGSVPFPEMVPLVLCKQYTDPIKIDGTKFQNCPGLNRTICDKPESAFVRSACELQCARIQIDALADACWKMGGRGKYKLTGWAVTTVWAIEDVPTHLRNAFRETWNGFISFQQMIRPECLVFPEICEKFKVDKLGFTKRTGALRCFRFQIVNPVYTVGPTGERFKIDLTDDTYGHSQIYRYNDVSLGGEGVESTEGIKQEFWYLLNYNYKEPRDVCYITYYEHAPGVGRSCQRWVQWAETWRYLN